MVTARMPLERFIEEHIESLKENYICPLCQGVFYNATSDPCGHVFCFECLDITLEKTGKCPISNNDVNIKDCHLVTVIDNYVKSRTITCGMKNCKWSGLLRDYFKHLDRGCEHVFVVCPNPKCKEAYPKWKTQIHKDECKYGYIDCKQCNSEVMKLYAENHYYNCPNVIINCSKGCGKLMLRKDLKDHIEDECTHIKYNCPFKIIGCTYNSIKAEITKHIKDDYSNHFLLFKKQIDLLDKKISVVNKYDYMIHRQLKRLNLKEDFKKNINHLCKDDEKELYMKYLKQDNEFDKEVKDNEEIIDMEISNIKELSLKEPTFLNKKDSFVFLNILPMDNLRINLKSNMRKNNIKQEENNDKSNNNIRTNVLFKTEIKIKPEVLKEERMEKKRIMKERKIFERKLRKLQRQLEKQKEKKFKLNESGTRREGKIYRKKKNKLRRLLGELKRGRPRKENNLTGPYDIEYKYFKVPKKEVEKVTNPSNYVPYNKIEVVIDDDKKKKLTWKEQVERDSKWNMEPDSSTSSDLQSSNNNANFNINNLSDSEMKQEHRNRQVKEKRKISSEEKLYRKLHNRIDIDKVSLSSDTTSNNEEEDEEDEEDNDSNEDSEQAESDKNKTDEKEEEEEEEAEEEEEEERIAGDSSSEEVYRGQDLFKKYDKQSSTIRRRNNSLETNELTLDMINSSKEISLEGKVATLTKINHKNADSGFNFKTLFASIFINGSKIKWVVKILRMQRRMALGIGVQEDIIANKHDLFNSKGNINKGVCVVTSNACFFSLYGNKDPVKMNIKSNFKQDDLVEFAYDYTTDLLTVTVLLQTDNGIEKKTAFQISEIGGNLRKMLVPIIMFLDIGDSAIMDLVYQKY